MQCRKYARVNPWRSEQRTDSYEVSWHPAVRSRCNGMEYDMISKPICVAPTGDQCGEGIVWHDAHAAVYWTDINRFLIHRFRPADRGVRTWLFDEPVSA